MALYNFTKVVLVLIEVFNKLMRVSRYGSVKVELSFMYEESSSNLSNNGWPVSVKPRHVSILEIPVSTLAV